MAHPLVEQLRFARTEFLRALEGIPDGDGERRLQPMNSIGWIVGHMAWHEQLYWLTRMQDLTPLPALNEIVATGGPATTPALGEMLDAWRSVSLGADPWLEALDQGAMLDPLRSSPIPRTLGSSIRRVTYHYFFHTGEILAIRQVMGHPDLPEFVGALDSEAPYRPE